MSHRWIFPFSVTVLTVICPLPTLAGSFLDRHDSANSLENASYRGLGPAQMRWAWSLNCAALPLLRAAFIRSPDAPSYRASLVQALQGRAAELRARGQGVESDELLAEARVLGADTSAGSSTRP